MNKEEKLRDLHLNQPIAVIGMGVSGKAAWQMLQKAGYDVTAFDEKVQSAPIVTVNLDDADIFASFATLIVSPGIDCRRTAFKNIHATLMNDVELFARLIEKPVAAVTGSNGKSTVVTMLADAARAAGLKTQLCGNIGKSVLTAWLEDEEEPDLYVLELSSYQLERCPSLMIDVGAVLNVTPDHLDRYDSFLDYVAAKSHLAQQTQLTILNGDDEYCRQMAPLSRQTVFFGAQCVNRVENGAIIVNGQTVLTADELKIHGQHNAYNALVALLMASGLGIDISYTLEALKNFRGLPHRMCEVACFNDVLWLNDSKATNIASTAAALVGCTRPTWLIVGGVGKGQDFHQLAAVLLQAPIKHVLMIGVDNHTMIAAFKKANIAFHDCGTIKAAVSYAYQNADAGDQVLLSPATASFDQFRNYEERGDVFANEVLSYVSQK